MLIQFMCSRYGASCTDLSASAASGAPRICQWAVLRTVAEKAKKQKDDLHGSSAFMLHAQTKECRKRPKEIVCDQGEGDCEATVSRCRCGGAA